MNIKPYLVGGYDLPSRIADLGPAALRIFTGLSMALAHGIHKMPPSQQFIDGVGEMGLPFPIVMAWAAALSEFLGGLMLAAGLLTRPAALAIIGTMGVAAFVAHAGDPFGKREMALLYGIVAVAFAFKGAGRYSIDRLLR